MRPRLLLVVALALLGSCATSSKTPERRAVLQAAAPGAVTLVPTEGQLPYCLVFSVSRKGVVRQLTTNDDNVSVPCKAGQPIGEAALPLPPEDGPVRIHILFSDRPLDAGPIDAQIRDLAAEKPSFAAMDLRAPGQVLTETIEHAPSAARSAP